MDKNTKKVIVVVSDYNTYRKTFDKLNFKSKNGEYFDDSTKFIHKNLNDWESLASIYVDDYIVLHPNADKCIGRLMEEMLKMRMGRNPVRYNSTNTQEQE